MSRFFERVLGVPSISLQQRVPVRVAVAKAQSDYQRFNPITDQEEVEAVVHRLSQSGVPAKEIAIIVNRTPRHVVRIRAKIRDFGPRDQERIAQGDFSDQRIRELEKIADVVVNMACVLRDEDPQKALDTLRKLDVDSLVEFAMVALAAVPVDRLTKKELFNWLNDLPACRYEEVSA